MTKNEPNKEYPYLPKGRVFIEISPDNQFMKLALEECEKMAKEHPEVSHQTCSLIEKGGNILAKERGGQIHPSFCPRVAIGSLSGEEYDFCPDHCHSRNHSEANATRAAGEKANGANLYLAGHWWACKPCWDKIISAGIKNVYLVEGSKNRYHTPRLTMNKRAGKTPSPLNIYIEGDFFEKLIPLLEKVDINSVDFDKADVVVLTKGANKSAEDFPDKKVYDYQTTDDCRMVLYNFSKDLEKEITQEIQNG